MQRRDSTARKEASFLSFFVVMAKSCLSETDLNKLGVSWGTASRTIADLRKAGAIQDPLGRHPGGFSDRTVQKLVEYVRANPGTRFIFATSLVRVIGMKDWSPAEIEYFIQALQKLTTREKQLPEGKSTEEFSIRMEGS